MKTMNKRSIAGLIAECGKTPDILAAEIGCSTTPISNWLSGSCPRQKYATKIAEATNAQRALVVRYISDGNGGQGRRGAPRTVTSNGSVAAATDACLDVLILAQDLLKLSPEDQATVRRVITAMSG